jgi:hypothetical protein
VCRKLEVEKMLGAHFFCKRDDPDLRSPERALNTIVHRLASWYKPYGRAVATAIENNVELPNASMEQRYSHLVEKLTQKIEDDNIRPEGFVIVVVDALDECELGGSRPKLLTYLQNLSRLVPWLKVVVTSRRDPDIVSAFEGASNLGVASIDAHDYDASLDILAYTQERMSDIARKKGHSEWPVDRIHLLSERADGLFIWAETACKFIENGVDIGARLDQIIRGTQSTKGSLPLDLLYTAAITHSMGDDDEDNLRSVQRFLAAIVATASRTPLSVVGLQKLLAGYIEPSVIQNLVAGLSSVLYEDKSSDRTVRVYHQSFADYVINEPRAKRYYLDPEVQNGVLAQRCLEIMVKELRFNICGLETSHVRNCDVSGLEIRVKDSISEHLKYSCLHWSSHLVKASKGPSWDKLENFLFGRELLYWIEALSLLGELGVGLSSLQDLVRCISVSVSSE